MPDGRLAVFIDGANLHSTSRALGFEVDFKRLLAELNRRGRLLRAYFYTTVSAADDFNSIQPLLDWLDYNGFTVRTKPLREHDDGEGRRRFRRNIAIDLAIDALEAAAHVDHIYLFSGDGDYRSLVQALQRRGVLVTVVSTIRSKPAPIAADELRRQADAFLDLDDLRSLIART
jgi:uncharacterized LabA/DUF88 family protein